ncbi:MAG TPA: hypothetical protein VEW25_09735 [Allosphingosinicella sp.]|nr:hypothetical protein [Allosphingosinicella sp.]
MRQYWLHFAAISAVAVPATAAGAQEQAPPPAPAPSTAAPAPAPPPTAEERQRLVVAAQRGVQLFELARAAQLTTQDMLARIPDPAAAGISGWVAAPEGEGLAVVYYAEGPEGPVAAYRGQVVGGRVAAGEVFAGADRPPLDAVQRRMAAARSAVAGVDRQPCSGDFNVFVIPPASAEAPIEVYKLSPQTQRGRFPLGGHFLVTVAPDGTVGSTRAFTNRCLDLEAPSETVPVTGNAAPARPLAVTHLLDPLPTEIHVFLSLWMNRPLLVATGEPSRLWTVARGRIGMVGGAQTPPPGPGR